VLAVRALAGSPGYELQHTTWHAMSRDMQHKHICFSRTCHDIDACFSPAPHALQICLLGVLTPAEYVCVENVRFASKEH
jgi:hypothetical protein